MRFIYSIALLGIFLGAVLWPTLSQATHVRAGEITTRRISETSLTYEVTLTTYYDEVGGQQAAGPPADEYTICFGDGTTQSVKRLPKQFINGRTSSINTYRTTHTYPGPGSYTISVAIPNRNANTKNLQSGASETIQFYVSTTIFINPALGLNSTPRLLNPPLDSGRVGQRFCHNPAAFDPDGDSLAFRLSIPQDIPGLSGCRGRNIPTYLDPTRFSKTSETGGTPTFSINARTGELCWDAPGEEGQFNFAFIVEEWRNGVLIGEVTRDMQIIVVDQPNKRPLIQPMPDLCVVAGTLINQPVTATDPDGNRVFISAFGGVFNVGADNLPLPAGELIPPAYARLVGGGSVTAPLTQPATATFSWQTSCNQIREAPYDVTFKVNDVPGRNITSLVSFQTLRIRIIGPAVQNLTARPTATASGRAIQLNWSAYSCAPRTGRDSTELIIYRKEGCSTIDIPPCTTGLPANSGYREIGRVSAGVVTFTDTSALRRGVSYSYRLVAEYPDRSGSINGGLSVASQQACLELPLLAPVLTQVTVDSTSDTRGRITVRWSRPIGLQPGDLGGPYQYRLQRATGLDGTNWTPVATINTDLAPTAPDTLYIDRGLNTSANAYRYRLEFYYTDAATRQLTRLDVTEPASSVRLTAAPAQRRISLSWQAATPWSNDNQTHDVYRSRSGPNGPFNLIAQVPVTNPASFTFVDTGEDRVVTDGNTSRVLSADSSYCYRVMTRGRYPATDTRLAGLGLLTNYSQIQCATPVDTTRPCPPQLGLDSLNCASLTPESLCNQTSFTNNLRWTPTSGPTCDPNVVGYKLYYARYRGDSLGVLASVPSATTSFAHSSLTTVAGCYYVTAVSGRGLESRPSNTVCNQACPQFALPNVFTPNGDGKNDVFEALRCPAFVEQVELIVYNRWGVKVYQSVGGSLSWDGRSSEGAELPSGLYYYQVSVRFGLLERNAPPQVYKGWVQILRETVSQR
jgi:gliding motility-associated-like protein